MTGGGHHVQWLPLGIAALLALLSTWLNHLAELPLVEDNSGFAHDPDYVVEDFNAQAYDLAGRPKHRLQARRMTHYMDDDSIELEAPSFLLTTPGRAPVEVHGRRGLVFADVGSVHFLGDVRVTQAATVDQAAFTLDTEHLRVVPDAGILSSDKPVILRQGNSVINAGSLFIDDHNKLLTLIGGVRGHYEKTL